MQLPDQPILKDIVLLGGGHSHVGVLRRFAMRPAPGVRLTLVCRDTHTPYSGMLPGYIAGHYDYDDVHIDLRRLAEFAGARFYRDEAVGLDRNARTVLCRERPPLPYDLLSINIGATPRTAEIAGASEHAVAVKPINRFNERWLALLDRVRSHPGTTRIAVVGGGAGGVELTLAMQYRLHNELRLLGSDPAQLSFRLFTSHDILPTHAPSVRRRFAAILTARGVDVQRASRVMRVEDGCVITESNARFEADEVVWVTRAGGAEWLRETGLALDRAGCIEVRDTLQSVTDPLIFAAGDVATMIDYPREKAGVIAVRQAPPLAANLRRVTEGRAPRPYRPQRKWLALISTGDRHAVASRGGVGFGGDWVWQWKDWIDRRFMARFNDLKPMTKPPRPAPSRVALGSEGDAEALTAVAMRCGGCGAKIGASVLSRALSTLRPLARDDVLVGLHAPDDAAVVRVPAGKAMVHTVDFFRAFIDDPFIFGQIAANHALGDIFAMGAEAQSATAVATVPYGLERKVEDTLFQMMAGALLVLNEADCALVGGHSGEGRELALGFAVNGLIDDDVRAVMSKGGMRAGEVLILTKPLGTGTLLAAHAQLRARGRWIDAALDSMRQSSRAAARCLRAHGATACTDVTGFGLLGHLVEMTRAAQLDAEIKIADLPLLEGAEDTAAAGLLSSLQPANLRLRRALQDQQRWTNDPRYALLFDPQTAGGLLASVPPAQVHTCIAALHAQGYPHACVIGSAGTPGDSPGSIRLV